MDELQVLLGEMIAKKKVVQQKGIEYEGRPSKQLKLSEFQTVDKFNEQMSQIHNTLHRLGFLTAVHHQRTSDVLIGLGGFKILYPLFEKVLKSNLAGLGREKPSIIFGQIFKILLVFLNQEPGHIDYLYQEQRLLPLLNYVLIKIGKRGLVTSSLITSVKSILKHSIAAQARIVNGKLQSTLDELEMKEFYEKFLPDFFHSIVLDMNFLALECY